MSRNAWLDEVEQTQLLIRQQPDHCFVCGNLVPSVAPDALIQAYRDEEHQERIAVVCGRRECRLALQDPTGRSWPRLFDALTHWPDQAIYPHGPYWVLRRPHHLTFRTAPRRTTSSDTRSEEDKDDMAPPPSTEYRPAPPRPLSGSRHSPTRRPWPNRGRR